jgi:hypothetical protein
VEALLNLLHLRLPLRGQPLLRRHTAQQQRCTWRILCQPLLPAQSDPFSHMTS